jgi:hypothetical protein
LLTCASLIGIYGYLGYLHNKTININKATEDIGKKLQLINILEIVGFVLDLLDYFLISSEKLAPELLYSYYTQHKIFVKIIYCFGGLILIGIFTAFIFIKSNISNNNAQFNEVELR